MLCEHKKVSGGYIIHAMMLLLNKIVPISERICVKKVNLCLFCARQSLKIV